MGQRKGVNPEYLHQAEFALVSRLTCSIHVGSAVRDMHPRAQVQFRGDRFQVHGGHRNSSDDKSRRDIRCATRGPWDKTYRTAASV